MSEFDKLPRQLSEVTPAWLSWAIGKRCPGVDVVSFSVEKIIPGTTTKALLHLTYDGDTEKYGLPSQLCIKGEFDEELRGQLKGVNRTGTQTEAEFYNEMGPALNLPLPKHWFGGAEPGMGILILDNLELSGCTFGSPKEPWTVDLVSKSLDILSILHAKSWGKKFDSFDWVTVGAPTTEQYTRFLLSAEHWESHFTKQEAFKMPEGLQDRAGLMRAFESMWEYDKKNSNCLVHGDAHVGNTYIDTTETPISSTGPVRVFPAGHWIFRISSRGR